MVFFLFYFHRKREKHLAVLLLNLHPFLQKQQLAYTIFIVNQVSYISDTYSGNLRLTGVEYVKVAFSMFSNTNQSACNTHDLMLNSQSDFDWVCISIIGVFWCIRRWLQYKHALLQKIVLPSKYIVWIRLHPAITGVELMWISHIGITFQKKWGITSALFKFVCWTCSPTKACTSLKVFADCLWPIGLIHSANRSLHKWRARTVEIYFGQIL